MYSFEGLFGEGIGCGGEKNAVRNLRVLNNVDQGPASVTTVKQRITQPQPITSLRFLLSAFHRCCFDRRSFFFLIAISFWKWRFSFMPTANSTTRGSRRYPGPMARALCRSTFPADASGRRRPPPESTSSPSLPCRSSPAGHRS